MRVLAGLDPQKSQQDAGKEEVRAAILEMFPALAKIDEETLNKVLQTAQHGDLMKQTTDAYWDRHADQMVGELRKTAADAIGMDLNDKQAKRLEREYTHMIRVSVAARERAKQSGDPTYDFQNDALARHNKGDVTLLKEFVKDFTEDFVEPVRRQAVSAQARRFGQPVPSGGRQRQAMAQGPPQIDYNNEEQFKDAIRKSRNPA